MRRRVHGLRRLVTGLLGVLVLMSTTLTAASARPTGSGPPRTTSSRAECGALRLTGETVTRARARARRSGCRLEFSGARLRAAAVQTISRQQPTLHGNVIAVWLNPLCWRSADPGPPKGEPLVTSGRTGLTAGLFLAGGPAIPFSNPRCLSPTGTARPGTVTVANATTGQVIATRTLALRELAFFALAPGRYALSGGFASASNDGRPDTETAGPVTVAAGHTTRQDVIAAIP